MTKNNKQTEPEREAVGTYDPQANALLEIGTYPAHIIAVTTNVRSTRIGEALVYNLGYRLAEEISKMEQPLYERAQDGNFKVDENDERVIVKDDEGEDRRVSCGFAAGREIQRHGVFLFTEDTGRGANSRYVELMKIAGVEPTEVEVQPGVSVKQLVKLLDSDLLGKPVLIAVNYRPVATRETRELPPEQQEMRYWLNVTEVNQWASGEVIEVEKPDSDLPF